MINNNFSFPLYDSLNTPDLQNHDMTTIERDSLVDLIESLDNDGKELIFILTKKYQLNEHPNDKSRIPFSGKRTKKDLKFDLTDMPNKLKHLLYKFAVMHHKTMKEHIDRFV